jgi:hypothetical protein
MRNFEGAYIIQDNPLRQWAEDHRETYLAELLRHEGRGDHATEPGCTQCTKGAADHRCSDCLGGGELLCSSCIVTAHRQMPFHRIQVGCNLTLISQQNNYANSGSQYWTGLNFERRTLKQLGLRIQLGHWQGPDRACPVPVPAPGDDFVIVDNHAVHQVGLDYCGCGHGGHPTVQLLRAKLWAATTTNPRTAATFSVLRRYHLLSFESKCAALEFYKSLARETDNLHHKTDKVSPSDAGLSNLS